MSLADLYASAAQTKTAAELQKLAEDPRTLELYKKYASDHNVNVAAMNDDELGAAFNSFVAKLAEEEGKAPPFAKKEDGEESEEDKKKREAAAEKKKEAALHDVQRLWAKEASHFEADQMGRQMAHALVDELQKIAKGDTSTSTEVSAKIASKLALDSLGPTPGLDAYAHDVALGIVANASNNNGEAVKEASDRIVALYQLGKFDTAETKIASARTFDDVAVVRAYEQLEQIGYSVDWQKVLGGLDGRV